MSCLVTAVLEIIECFYSLNKCESSIKLYFSEVTIIPDADGDGFENNLEIIDNTNENTWDLIIKASLQDSLTLLDCPTLGEDATTAFKRLFKSGFVCVCEKRGRKANDYHHRSVLTR